MNRDFRIKATIGLVPPDALDYKEAQQYITRGATETFTLDIYEKAYTFDQIEQVTFAYKQVDGTIISYDMYQIFGDQDSINDRFKHFSGPEYDYITLTLESKETAKFKATKPGQVVLCEIAISIDSDDQDENHQVYTTIEQQPNIGVIDSIYGELIGD